MRIHLRKDSKRGIAPGVVIGTIGLELSVLSTGTVRVGVFLALRNRFYLVFHFDLLVFNRVAIMHTSTYNFMNISTYRQRGAAAAYSPPRRGGAWGASGAGAGGPRGSPRDSGGSGYGYETGPTMELEPRPFITENSGFVDKLLTNF